MDTDLLVDQKDAGRLLIEQLQRDGFQVSIAFWVRTSEDGPWYLYIASPSVDEERTTEAYRKLYSSLNRVASPWVSPSDLKLLSDQNPIARAALEVRERYPGASPTYYQGKRLGDLAIKGAYIYPEFTPLRLSFTVTYHRKAGTNNWTASLKRGRLYRGMRAKGAVSYSTARREGEEEADESFAIVGVLVELDPKYVNPDILDLPDMQRMTADQARTMADVMFRTHHPDAVIEHDQNEEE